MGYIPDELVDEIRNASNIVDVVSEYVRLKKQGRNFIGLCPFHTEKTPSFTVSEEKQIFRCFGCGEGGNVFTFLMKIENLSFPEAVERLADRYGIIIPKEDTVKVNNRFNENRLALEINNYAKEFYHYILLNHKVADEARNYIESRDINKETVKEFQIGFAPPSWDGLYHFLIKKGFKPEKLEKLGLVQARARGSGYYDKFRNRIMFPIWNEKGKVVGFGGRVMDDSLPKYLNTPETFLFNKRNLLYGINLAADSIRQKNQAIIVEGYLDVISCHQAGIKNVVASLGTAFTEEQGRLLLRYVGVTGEVIIAYDMDAAGIKAAMKGWNLLYKDLGCRVKLLGIPDGKDPDEFIRNHGSEEFLELVRNKAQPYVDFLTDRLLEKISIDTLEGKFKIASEVIPIIRMLSNEIEKEEAIVNLSKRLHLSPDAIKVEVEKVQSGRRNYWGKRDKITGLRHNNSDSVQFSSETGPQNARVKAEEALLILMLEEKEIFKLVKDELGVNFSSKPEYLNIIKLLDDMFEKDPEFRPASIFEFIDDQKTAKVLSSLMMREVHGEDRDKIVHDYIKTIREDEIRKKREDILKQMEEADKLRDHELRKKLLIEYSKLL